MADNFARATSVLSCLIAAGSLYLSYSNWLKSAENISIEIKRTELSISDDRGSLTLSGAIDLYNLSTNRITVSDASITGAQSYMLAGPTEISRRSAWCKQQGDFDETIEPRASVEISFSCKIYGGPNAVEYLKSYTGTDYVPIFLTALYHDEGIDFFDHSLEEGLNGMIVSASLSPEIDSRYASPVWIPFIFRAKTRAGNLFQEKYFYYAGLFQ